MHTESLDAWRHHHTFLGERHHDNERRVWLVVALTIVTMVAEIIGGALFGSVALTADGWHMATHAAALSISGVAYVFGRRHTHNPRYTFGTGKFGELAGYTSAVLLAVVSIGIVYQASHRFLDPVDIHYTEAMLVAVLGLLVNVVSAWLLSDHQHGERHSEASGHDHHAPAHHEDGNRRAAFAHVAADALTSALAIVALMAASQLGWKWIDPLVGCVGAVLIAVWALALMRRTSATLLDALPSNQIADAVRAALEVGDDRVADLHIWQLGPGHMGAIVSIVTHEPRSPAYYKAKLASIPHLSHTTIEVQHCT